MPHYPESFNRASFPGFTLRKESPRVRTVEFGPEWRLQDMKNGDEIGIHHRCHPSMSLPQPYPPPGKEMFKEIQSELEPNWPPLAARPRHKNWFSKNKKIREKWHSSTIKLLKIRSATIVPILFLSFLHQTNKKEDITAHQNENFESKKYLEDE